MKDMNRDLDMSEPRPMGGELNMSEPAPKHFPTIHFEGPEELDLPSCGTMLVEFEVKREVETRQPESGKHWYQCDIAIKKIISAEAEKDISPSRRDRSAEDNLDRLMKEHEAEEAAEGDEY